VTAWPISGVRARSRPTSRAVGDREQEGGGGPRPVGPGRGPPCPQREAPPGPTGNERRCGTCVSRTGPVDIRCSVPLFRLRISWQGSVAAHPSDRVGADRKSGDTYQQSEKHCVGHASVPSSDVVSLTLSAFIFEFGRCGSSNLILLRVKPIRECVAWCTVKAASRLMIALCIVIFLTVLVSVFDKGLAPDTLQLLGGRDDG
jgi:hypothetical protein